MKAGTKLEEIGSILEEVESTLEEVGAIFEGIESILEEIESIKSIFGIFISNIRPLSCPRFLAVVWNEIFNNMVGLNGETAWKGCK